MEKKTIVFSKEIICDLAKNDFKTLYGSLEQKQLYSVEEDVESILCFDTTIQPTQDIKICS